MYKGAVTLVWLSTCDFRLTSGLRENDRSF